MFGKNKLLYGCDYNPEQWKKYPDILEEDIRLMKEAGCNVMSIGIFSWSELEPEEGKYDFSFFDQVVDRLEENGIDIILATPSAARPAWMAKKYPEILRTDEYGIKQRFGRRQNHCFTSPIYRKKVREINEQLAKRYGSRKSVIAWHVSNEYGGDCRCALCEEAFRGWLKEKYHNSLDELNEQWWSSFWSHTYTDWDQIEPPSAIGEGSVQALEIDWKRFVTHQTRDFYRNEIEPLKRIAPHIPVTTNFHGSLEDINYWEFADDIDFSCWDRYPAWHNDAPLWETACESSFVYDVCRSIKGETPFLLMESTPSNVNWAEACKLKRPGINQLASLQAISCGADSVQYFQWRKSRGAEEKFHGAVVDHYGKSDTRVFREAAQTGQTLAAISELAESCVRSKAAIIYDWENHWGIKYASGFQKGSRGYIEECIAHYKCFWERGCNVDVINRDHDLSKYEVVIAPMLYMMDEKTIQRMEAYVKNGGTLVSGYMSGYVNENDLCHLGGFPGGELKNVFGIWNEEIDTLYPQERNHVEYQGKTYEVRDYFEHIHLKTAEQLGSYADDFLQGMPAVTVNSYGKGKAYYIAFRGEEAFLQDFYEKIIKREYDLPQGVSVRTRETEANVYLLFQNWTSEDKTIRLPDNKEYEVVYRDDQNTAENRSNCSEGTVTENIIIGRYGTVILRR